jgi:hypothetical protein
VEWVVPAAAEKVPKKILVKMNMAMKRAVLMSVEALEVTLLQL